MESQDCRMIQVVVESQECIEKGAENIFPIAEAIVIASSRLEGEEYAKQELRPHLGGKNDCSFRTEDLGRIFFLPRKTTVFLYSQAAGRIK